MHRISLIFVCVNSQHISWKLFCRRPLRQCYQNRIGPLVKPKKTGTGPLYGLILLKDRLSSWIGKNRFNRLVFYKTAEQDRLKNPVQNWFYVTYRNRAFFGFQGWFHKCPSKNLKITYFSSKSHYIIFTPLNFKNSQIYPIHCLFY